MNRQTGRQKRLILSPILGEKECITLEAGEDWCCSVIIIDGAVLTFSNIGFLSDVHISF
jgi:hypothetical protein